MDTQPPGPPLPRLPLAFGRRDLEQAGVSESGIRHRCRTGRWVRLGRGLYADRQAWEVASGRERAAANALSRWRNDHGSKVVSHLSAAAIHGLPLPLDFSDAAWFTTDEGGNHPRRAGSLIIERASLAPHDRVLLDEAELTTVARTVADCARHLRLTDAVAMGDHALRTVPGLGEPLHEVFLRQAGWPGARRARTAYRLFDPRRESWLESVSAVRFFQSGLPIPEPQVVVFDEQGRFVGRVDALWHEWGVVGEADGRGKYVAGSFDPPPAASSHGRQASGASGPGPGPGPGPRPDPGPGSRRSGQAAADPEAARLFAVQAVLAEKRRESRIRALGLEVVRWDTAGMLRGLGTVLRDIDSARRRGGLERFSGRMTFTPWPCPPLTPLPPLRPLRSAHLRKKLS